LLRRNRPDEVTALLWPRNPVDDAEAVLPRLVCLRARGIGHDIVGDVIIYRPAVIDLVPAVVACDESRSGPRRRDELVGGRLGLLVVLLVVGATQSAVPVEPVGEVAGAAEERAVRTRPLLGEGVA